MGWLGLRAKAAWRLVFHSLSGRLLLLTLFFAMVTQVLIFVPSVARYHHTLLDNHIEAAEMGLPERPAGPSGDAGRRARRDPGAAGEKDSLPARKRARQGRREDRLEAG